jgi:spatacsin
MIFFSPELKKPNYITVFRYWIKEQDFFKHKSVLDSFLKYDLKDEFNKQDHRIVLNWAQWWDQPTQEYILLPRISPEGKYEKVLNMSIFNED